MTSSINDISLQMIEKLSNCLTSSFNAKDIRLLAEKLRNEGMIEVYKELENNIENVKEFFNKFLSLLLNPLKIDFLEYINLYTKLTIDKKNSRKPQLENLVNKVNQMVEHFDKQTPLQTSYVKSYLNYCKTEQDKHSKLKSDIKAKELQTMDLFNKIEKLENLKRSLERERQELSSKISVKNSINPEIIEKNKLAISNENRKKSEWCEFDKRISDKENNYELLLQKKQDIKSKIDKTTNYEKSLSSNKKLKSYSIIVYDNSELCKEIRDNDKFWKQFEKELISHKQLKYETEGMIWKKRSYFMDSLFSTIDPKKQKFFIYVYCLIDLALLSKDKIILDNLSQLESKIKEFNVENWSITFYFINGQICYQYEKSIVGFAKLKKLIENNNQLSWVESVKTEIKNQLQNSLRSNLNKFQSVDDNIQKDQLIKIEDMINSTKYEIDELKRLKAESNKIEKEIKLEKQIIDDEVKMLENKTTSDRLNVENIKIEENTQKELILKVNNLEKQICDFDEEILKSKSNLKEDFCINQSIGNLEEREVMQKEKDCEILNCYINFLNCHQDRIKILDIYLKELSKKIELFIITFDISALSHEKSNVENLLDLIYSESLNFSSEK